MVWYEDITSNLSDICTIFWDVGPEGRVSSSWTQLWV